MSGNNDGINQRVMDMGEAIAKLTTDIDWVKGTLSEIKASLEHNDEEMKRMLRDYQSNVDKRLEEHEERIEKLEEFRSKAKGVAIALSALSSSAIVVYIITKLIGG